jgi:hypothetical protein
VIIDTIILNNAGGFNMQGAAGAANSAFLLNCVVDNNSSFATQIVGASTLVISGNQLIGSPSSIIASGGAAVISYQNNMLRNAGAPTQSLPLQ